MLIVFSMVVGIGSLIVIDISSTANGYNVPNISDDSFDDTYNKLQETKSLVDTSGNETRKGLGKLLGNDNTFFGSTLVVLDLTFGSFSMVNSVFASFITYFGVPAEIANLFFPAILAIITTIIIFVAISSLTRSKM